MRSIGVVILCALVSALVGLGTAAGAISYAFVHQAEIVAYMKDIMYPPRVEAQADLQGLEMKLVQNLYKKLRKKFLVRQSLLPKGTNSISHKRNGKRSITFLK